MQEQDSKYHEFVYYYLFIRSNLARTVCIHLFVLDSNAIWYPPGLFYSLHVVLLFILKELFIIINKYNSVLYYVGKCMRLILYVMPLNLVPLLYQNGFVLCYVTFTGI